MEVAIRDLYRNELITKVTSKADTAKIIEQYMVGLKAGINSMLIVVMLLAPIFLFTSLTLSVQEKEKDFIILRSMGSSLVDVWKIILSESAILGFLGSLLSIPIAVIMGYLQNRFAGRLFFGTDTYIRASDYMPVVYCLPLFVLVAFVFSRKIAKLNIVQQLMTRIA